MLIQSAKPHKAKQAAKQALYAARIHCVSISSPVSQSMVIREGRLSWTKSKLVDIMDRLVHICAAAQHHDLGSHCMHP